MTIDNSLIGLELINGVYLVFKVGFLAVAVLYFFFSLIVIRQVSLMTETIVTEGGSILRALSILHGGLALGVIILFIGLL